jgi:hypothetical protein
VGAVSNNAVSRALGRAPSLACENLKGHAQVTTGHTGSPGIPRAMDGGRCNPLEKCPLLLQSLWQRIRPLRFCERDGVIIRRALEQVVGITIALDETLADS